MTLRNLWCAIRGHRLVKVRPLLIGGELVICQRCKTELCIHHGRQQVIPFDADVKKIEYEFQEVIKKFGDKA